MRLRSGTAASVKVQVGLIEVASRNLELGAVCGSISCLRAGACLEVVLALNEGVSCKLQQGADRRSFSCSQDEAFLILKLGCEQGRSRVFPLFSSWTLFRSKGISREIHSPTERYILLKTAVPIDFGLCRPSYAQAIATLRAPSSQCSTSAFGIPTQDLKYAALQQHGIRHSSFAGTSANASIGPSSSVAPPDPTTDHSVHAPTCPSSFAAALMSTFIPPSASAAGDVANNCIKDEQSDGDYIAKLEERLAEALTQPAGMQLVCPPDPLPLMVPHTLPYTSGHTSLPLYTAPAATPSCALPGLSTPLQAAQQQPRATPTPHLTRSASRSSSLSGTKTAHTTPQSLISSDQVDHVWSKLTGAASQAMHLRGDNPGDPQDSWTPLAVFLCREFYLADAINTGICMVESLQPTDTDVEYIKVFVSSHCLLALHLSLSLVNVFLFKALTSRLTPP
ncbi:hypothetical protein BDK51DRAFT_53202 [Blyttiomyces helicus]|uniref:Uncharacterized protein n=1 Tax=Blyttiomyces helicus TaxID=388810 RepID=A0A4P9WIN4_9FUNG|nr:hypothetical protein BDK51DRAFT_53202 [Blyttiomyces helicus]|eukprot:RKO91875.1 hypothetical protein BDK51DRAFT_53202 [Blyttiomyces helicus]